MALGSPAEGGSAENAGVNDRAGDGAIASLEEERTTLSRSSGLQRPPLRLSTRRNFLRRAP